MASRIIITFHPLTLFTRSNSFLIKLTFRSRFLRLLFFRYQFTVVAKKNLKPISRLIYNNVLRLRGPLTARPDVAAISAWIDVCTVWSSLSTASQHWYVSMIRVPGLLLQVLQGFIDLILSWWGYWYAEQITFWLAGGKSTLASASEASSLRNSTSGYRHYHSGGILVKGNIKSGCMEWQPG